MSQHYVPSGKLIDIDSSFEELNLLLEGDDDATKSASAYKHSTFPATQNVPNEPEIKDRFDDDDATIPTFDVSFSSATFEKPKNNTTSASKPSRWSQSASVGGTVLNNPAFQSDFKADYLLWSKVSAQQRKLGTSSAYSLTSSIVNIIGGGTKLSDSSAALVVAATSAGKKSSKFSLDSLLTSSAEAKLLPNSSSISQTASPKMSSSKYRPTEWSMSSLNSSTSAGAINSSTNSAAAAEKKMIDRRASAYGETQRLVDQGSATRLIVNDDEEYDSADGFGGFANRRRATAINGDEDEDLGSGGKMGGGSPCSNWSLYKGIFYSSLSSVFFSLSAVIVKYLKNIHPGQLAVCRFVGIFVLTIPLIVYHDLNPFGPPELRHLLIFRGLAGATSLFLRFVAFQNLPIADASVIIFSIPVFVSIFAWIFLKEPCGLFQSFTIIIAMIGLMMTTKLPFLFGGGDGGGDSSLNVSPSSTYYLVNRQLASANLSAKTAVTAANQLNLTNSSVSHLVSATNVSALVNGTTTKMAAASSSGSLNVAQKTMLRAIIPPSASSSSAMQASAKMNHFYGVLAALSSLVFASAVFIFIRKAKGAHYAVIMFNFGWVAVIETTLVTSLLEGFSLPATPFDWYLIVILGVFSFCGQILLTRSLQLEQAGPVSVVRATTDIALAFLWQVAIFKETPDHWSVLGALLVSSCILLTSLRKWVLSLPERSKLRERLFFLSL